MIANKNAATDSYAIIDGKGFSGKESTNKFASEWIEIPSNTDITFSGQTGNGYVPGIDIYFSSSNTDSNGFISTTRLTSSTGFTTTSPAEAKYLRCCTDRGVNGGNLNTFQIEIGSAATDYEAFSKVVKLEVEGLDLGKNPEVRIIASHTIKVPGRDKPVEVFYYMKGKYNNYTGELQDASFDGFYTTLAQDVKDAIRTIIDNNYKNTFEASA